MCLGFRENDERVFFPLAAQKQRKPNAIRESHKLSRATMCRQRKHLFLLLSNRAGDLIDSPV